METGDLHERFAAFAEDVDVELQDAGSAVRVADPLDQRVAHLPFAIDEIEILGSLTPHCHALVERVGDAHGGSGGILQFDIHILSESGESLVKITRFHVRALVPPAPSRSDAAADRARSSLAVNP
jgi:hypothetical protein